MRAIACLKPNIPQTNALTRHNVNESIFEPAPGHVFALPGKMTEVPYVAASLVRNASSKMDLRAVSMRPLDAMQAEATPDV